MLEKTENNSSRKTIYLLNGNDLTCMGNVCVRVRRLMGNV